MNDLEQRIKSYVRYMAEDLPDDAEIVICMPHNDGRFWVDILSKKQALETISSGYDDSEPLVDQYLLVSSNELQRLAPEVFEALEKREAKLFNP